jgi:hypothetical protein
VDLADALITVNLFQNPKPVPSLEQLRVLGTAAVGRGDAGLLKEFVGQLLDLRIAQQLLPVGRAKHTLQKKFSKVRP